jgi:hypothetical protein
MAIPAINTALIPSAQKDAFNTSDPADDASKYRSTAVTTIKGLRGAVDKLFGNDSQYQAGPLGNLTPEEVGGALIPDVVTLDFSKPLVFPNGRRLQDDVIDVALGLVLNRGGAAGISDGIGANDKAFLAAFPYLAAPSTTGGAAGVGGAATSGGPAAAGAPIRPPSTGDANMLNDSSTMWTLSAGLFVVAVVLGGAGALIALRRRR